MDPKKDTAKNERLTLETAYVHLKEVNFKMFNLDIKGAKEKHGDALLWCNLGNPQAVGQKPITYHREVMSAVTLPCLTDSNDMISETALIRQQIADFVTERDGYAARPEDIYMTNGATEGIQHLLRLLVRHDGDSVLLPCPFYPVYPSYLQFVGGVPLYYYLDEEDDWAVKGSELERAYAEAVSKGHPPRCINVINPNNPTGSVLSRESLYVICRFAHAHGLPILADEVYQRNIYEPDTRPFLSCHQIAQELESKGECQGLQVISLHSASKGLSAECGRRGGYMHFHNIDQELVSAFDDILSMGCPNIEGMVAMAAIVNPPPEGSDAYTLYREECDALLSSLARKAGMLADTFNSWDGMSCVCPAGSMYTYPRLEVPPKALAAAEREGISPDTMYVQGLLDAVGVVVLPGYMFGQKEGTYHLRMTILPPEDKLAGVLDAWALFHKGWMAKYQ
ncbi:hypothetical protein KIPB_009859 [Kipferlia bialata]|uniref:Aminotransferase class I/classII large domain-containing protein n=1 Tax=Kipferlia bialata TaxID=797122 RepID=A0A9K3D4F8_9EUKA|nr:hypothetical protein KIPB_009859 [Kipferlia bialata]|eukprot:g9859.t1